MKKLLYLIILLYLIGCNLSESAEPNPPIYSLIYESNIEIDVPEPSGLTYDSNTNTLWTVSDHSGKIYQLDLNGNVLQILPFVGEDLEGIAYDYTNNSFWVIEEGGRNLVNVNDSGIEIERYNHIIEGADNSGLEGICINSDGIIFLLKEKNPGQFVRLSSDFSTLIERDLSFADDYSGIYYDSEREGFWIVSDESEKLYLWDSINGVREEFSLNFPKAEGIVFLPESQTFYIVSDSEQKLYKYNLCTLVDIIFDDIRK